MATEVPEVVTVRDRNRVAKAGKSDSVSGSKPKAANDDRKPAILTAKTPRAIQLASRRAQETEWSKESLRFQQRKPPPKKRKAQPAVAKAIVTAKKAGPLRRSEKPEDPEEATTRARARIEKMLSGPWPGQADDD